MPYIDYILRCLSILKLASFEYSQDINLWCVRELSRAHHIYLPGRLPLESQKWLCISALANLNPLQKWAHKTKPSDTVTFMGRETWKKKTLESNKKQIDLSFLLKDVFLSYSKSFSTPIPYMHRIQSIVHLNVKLTSSSNDTWITNRKQYQIDGWTTKIYLWECTINWSGVLGWNEIRGEIHKNQQLKWSKQFL